MGSLFIKTGLSPLYDIEMLIKFCVFLDFVFFLNGYGGFVIMESVGL